VSKPYCKVTNCSRLTFRDSNYCYQHNNQEDILVTETALLLREGMSESEIMKYLIKNSMLEINCTSDDWIDLLERGREINQIEKSSSIHSSNKTSSGEGDIGMKQCSVKDCSRSQYKENLCHYHHRKSEEILNFDKKSGKSKSDLWFEPTLEDWMIIPLLILIGYGDEDGKWASKRFLLVLLSFYILHFLLLQVSGDFNNVEKFGYPLYTMIFVIVGWIFLTFMLASFVAAGQTDYNSHFGVSDISENDSSNFYKSGTVYTCINGHQISSYGITSKCPFCGKTMTPKF